MRIMKTIPPALFGLCLMTGGPASAQSSHDEERAVRLTQDEMEEFGILLEPVAAGIIGEPIQLTGEIVVNPDRFAHVVPRVDGVVRQVSKGLGDQVHKSEVMAIIDSRELADLKSAYLAALQREALTRTTHEREERLWREAISSERDYLEAKQLHAEAAIESRSARHKLLAIGLSEADLVSLPDEADAGFSRFEIRAPFDGVVIAQHITLGESVAADTEVYSVTDLREVWAVLTVYQRQLPDIREGLTVTIRDRESRSNGSARGHISYVSPVIDEATRTASVRVVLENPTGAWRPGMFVRGEVAAGGVVADVVVAPGAVQRLEDADVVFVHDGQEFHVRHVRTGRTSPGAVEIVGGLRAGEVVASQGAFTLKTQIEKGEFEAGHSH